MTLLERLLNLVAGVNAAPPPAKDVHKAGPLSPADVPAPATRTLSLSEQVDRYLQNWAAWKREPAITGGYAPPSVMPKRAPELDTYPCCSCCLKYSPQPCPAIHRDPCDKAPCGQTWHEQVNA